MNVNRWLVVAAGLVLWGCSSSPKVEKLPDSADAQEEVSRLQQDLDDAQRSQIDAAAPKAWKEASYYSKQAQSRLADQASKSRILYSVEEGRAWLKKAQQEAEQANAVIPELLEVRDQALQAKAPQFASNEWNDAEKYFRKLSIDREGTNVAVSDENRRHIQDLYRKARVRSLQNMYLGESRRAIHDAKEANAESLVPHSFVDASRSLKNAENFINGNPLDTTDIEQRAQKATSDAKHLLRLTKEAAVAKNTSPEEQAIALEKIKQRNQRLAGALDQQAFEQKFEEARQMFQPSEAEVYKQGDQLLIRLKGIEFPTASASLPPESYPLVSKVGRVIKDFDEQTTHIRIEGHTDERGAKPSIKLSRSGARKLLRVIFAPTQELNRNQSKSWEWASHGRWRATNRRKAARKTGAST